MLTPILIPKAEKKHLLTNWFSMQSDLFLAGMICAFLLFYLTYTILYPEKF